MSTPVSMLSLLWKESYIQKHCVHNEVVFQLTSCEPCWKSEAKHFLAWALRFRCCDKVGSLLWRPGCLSRWLEKQQLEAEFSVLTSLQLRRACFSSLLDSKSWCGRVGASIHHTESMPSAPEELPSSPGKEGHDFTQWGESSEKAYAVKLQQSILDSLKSHFQRELFAGNFFSLQTKAVSPLNSRNSLMTWQYLKFLNSQLFVLRAICSAFLIIPCLSGISPALSPAICKLNIFLTDFNIFLWAPRQYFI